MPGRRMPPAGDIDLGNLPKAPAEDMIEGADLPVSLGDVVSSDPDDPDDLPADPQRA